MGRTCVLLAAVASRAGSHGAVLSGPMNRVCQAVAVREDEGTEHLGERDVSLGVQR